MRVIELNVSAEITLIKHKLARSKISRLLYILALYKLEDDWKEIVTKNREILETERHQQAAIWELVQTEVAYIHTLKLVTDVSYYIGFTTIIFMEH